MSAMKTCAICNGLVGDSAPVVHDYCISAYARLATLDALNELEKLVAATPEPRTYGKRPSANYRMWQAMVTNHIADMKARLQGCTLGMEHCSCRRIL